MNLSERALGFGGAFCYGSHEFVILEMQRHMGALLTMMFIKVTMKEHKKCMHINDNNHEFLQGRCDLTLFYKKIMQI